jgi:hypothetical protein
MKKVKKQKRDRESIKKREKRHGRKPGRNIEREREHACIDSHNT